jgi:hypothetical protein
MNYALSCPYKDIYILKVNYFTCRSIMQEYRECIYKLEIREKQAESLINML